MTTRTARLAWGLWAGVMLLAIAYAVLFYLDRGISLEVYAGIWVETTASLALATVGALIASRLPRNPIGWVLLGTAYSMGVNATLALYAIYALFVAPGRAPLGALAGWVGAWDYVPSIAGYSLVLLLFPTGRLPSQRWRPLLFFVIFTCVIFALVDALGVLVARQTFVDHSGQMSGLHPGSNSVYNALYSASFALNGIGLLGAGISLLLRFRAARGVERQQLRWLAFIAAPLTLSIALDVAEGGAGAGLLSSLLTATAMITIPVTVGFSVLRYRIYDIDIVISRSLVFVVLVVFVTVAYLGLVVGVGALIGSGGKPNLFLSILATAVVALAFQPVRAAAQRFANRIAYGVRATPYEVLSELSAGLEEAFAGEEILPRIARVLADGTGATEATVWVRVGDSVQPAARWPVGDGNVSSNSVTINGQLLPEIPGMDLVVPVRHQGELLGALTLTKRPGEPLTPIEDKLVADLAAQAGLVLRNAGLSAALEARLEDLRASRQRLVRAQDETRRQLERNLHDGAQQELVALKLKLGLARRNAINDPLTTEAMLGQLEADTGSALETLRDLARGIYPPLLADQGLPAALAAQARKATLPIEIDADGVGRYPQEAEAAVYFCVLEALQNVQKYAGASRAAVHLAQRNGMLSFVVDDDGAGFDPSLAKKGSGLQNMEDRLDALGGRLVIESAAGKGTHLHGAVPVGSDA